jgi:hypothetical protein
MIKKANFEGEFIKKYSIMGFFAQTLEKSGRLFSRGA